MIRRLGMAALVLAVASPALAQDTTLRWFTIFAADEVSRFEPVIRAYEEENPGIRIELETVAGSGAAVYPDVLRTSMASGEPPDIFFMWGGSIAQPFIDAGQVRELSDYYEQYGWEERFAPWLMDRLSSGDDIHGVPFRSRGMGLWYRADIFDEHGLAPPTSYDELETVCATLAENGIHCASFGGRFGWHTMRLLDYFLEDTCGAETHDAINARAESWEQPCVIEAFDRLGEWVERGWLVPDFLGVAPADARMPVYIGNAAMIYEVSGFEAILRGDGADSSQYDFFLPPAPSGRYHAFPHQWMIPAQARHQDEAAAFLDWIASADTQLRFRDAFGEGSSVEGVTPDCDVLPTTCKWADVLFSDLGTYPPTDQALTTEQIGGLFEAQDAVVAGRMTGAEAAALVQQRIEEHEAR